MKCSKCGREFGNGANCQNCGVDRVTGLGNYSGYDKPSGSYEPQYSSSNNGGYASNTMVCYACSEIIPKNSIYCPACGRQLWVECPNCGATYSSQYKICSKCGTNREVYYKQQEADRQRALREEEERQRKQREWEQSPEGKAELAEQKRKEEKEENERILTYIIGVPILGIIWYSGLKAILPNLGITILETCNSFLVILICLVLGYITLLLIDKDII